METLLYKKSDNFKFLTSFLLDIRAWPKDTQTNIVLLLYSVVLTNSATFSLCTYWKYLKLSFFDISRVYRKRQVVEYSNICNIERKTTELKSLFNKVADLQACKFIKKRLQLRCFPLNIAKFLRTAFLIEHLRWLLLDPVTHLRWSFFCASNLLFIL